MRLLDMRYVVVVGALSFALTGCLNSNETDAEMDDLGSDDDNASVDDDDEDNDPDTAIWEINLAGQATVDATTWVGTETWQIDDLTNDELLCIWTMESASTTPLDTCESCSFAFDVGYANSTGEEGDCGDYGLPDIAGEITTQDGPLKSKIGFMANFEHETIGTLANVMVMYYSGSASYEAGWYPFSYEGGGSFDEATGVFNYEMWPREIEGY